MGNDKTQVTKLNVGSEDEMKIVGYKRHQVKEVISWIATVLTIGILQLVYYWRPDWMLKCTCTVTSLDEAHFVLLRDQYYQIFVEKVKFLKITDSSYYKQTTDSKSEHYDRTEQEHDATSWKYFVNKKVKYMWNDERQQFDKQCGLEEGLSCSVFHQSAGLTNFQQNDRRTFYGSNVIIVHVTPIIKLLFTQALNPFYIFQLFSCALWYSDQYGWYATAILIISAISLTVEVYETRSMQRSLKSTLTPVEMVTVLRADTGEFETILSDSLVPGDIIEVPRQGCIMQCDAVLTTGNCIVNESMLTGESVPVTKTPVPNTCHPDVMSRVSQSNAREELFNIKDHSRHILFCGTRVIQTRYYGSQKVTAVVIRTGFATAKGELVRSILYPKPVDFKFSQDGIKFILFLALIALGGMVYTIVLMVQRGDTVSDIIVRSLDLITIVIPPALPAAMTIGIVFAQKRLRKRQIYCISPRSINLCGAINVFCFDKTGTLTEDGLDMWGIVPADGNRFKTEERKVSQLNQYEPVLAAMATCHSLTIIEGTIAGDPLDLKMFEATSWVLEEPGEDTSKFDIIMPTVVHPKRTDFVAESPGYESTQTWPYEIGILRQFTFTSKLQRMSVITRQLGSDHFDLYVKGSPEMISSLCHAKSVPANFPDILMYYTEQGYRVIGVAHRVLAGTSYVKVQRAHRDELEKDLTFLGLIVFENRLKPETTPIIKVLKDAQIRSVMVTGDNMLTALSVARDCDMIGSGENVILVTVLPPAGSKPAKIEYTFTMETAKKDKDLVGIHVEHQNTFHYAITGKSWALLRHHSPDLIPKLAVRGTVFARFSPDQKQQLIEALQDVGYYVGMCGDGANDCGALKTAHAGISLSEAEASVASPFTSKQPNIKCVPKLIQEGRAALVTSFGIFKYMAGYSLTQFLSVCLAYWIGANMTDFGFLYVDLVLIMTLGITFCYTKAYPALDPRPPRISLLSVTPILSLLMTFMVNLVAQVFAFLWIAKQPWFYPFVENPDDDYQCYEVTILFFMSGFQFIIMAVVFAKGAPYRKSIMTNYAFLINIILCTALTAYIVMYPMEWLVSLLEVLMPQSLAFRALILGIAAINFFASYLIELLFIDELIEGKLMYWWRQKNSGKVAHMRIAKELANRSNWPTDSQLGTSFADLMRLENPVSVPADDENDREEGKTFELREDDVQLEAEMDTERLITQMSVSSCGNDNVCYEQDADNEQNLLPDMQKNTTVL